MTKQWSRFWFEPASPANLGVCRILFFGALFVFYLPHDYSVWGDVSPVFWQPIWLFGRFHLPLLSRESLIVIQMAWRAALALSCVGLFTRAMTGVSFVLSAYLLGLPNNFGTEYHYDTIIVLSAAVLAVSRCGDAWSVDRLIRIARAGRRRVEAPPPSGEYRWPIRLIWVAMSLIFFAAGVAKIRHAGLQWVVSDHMATMLVLHQYHYSNADPMTSLGLRLAAYAWVCSLLAAATIVLETTYPLSLFSTRVRSVVVPSVFFMQIGIRVLMGPTFDQYLICNLFWIPWDRLGSRVRERLRAEPRYFVAFDGSCGLCLSTVAVIRALDLLGRVQILDLFTDWPTIAARFPEANMEACLETMHVFRNGRRAATGFDGYRVLARALPLAWPALPFLYLPGVPLAGRRIYAAVAARRARTCALPAPVPGHAGSRTA